MKIGTCVRLCDAASKDLITAFQCRKSAGLSGVLNFFLITHMQKKNSD